jgi:hypothetical protein
VKSNLKRTETCHFWIGRFSNARAVGKYFKENHDDENENPISQFAADQKEQYYDHDKMEYGFKAKPKSIEALVSGYSYSDQWSEELVQMVKKKRLEEMNMFVFINQSEIGKPRTVKRDDYELHYLGKITYDI